MELTFRSLDKYLGFHRIETLLLLDDLSVDGAGEVCEKWAKTHPQVRVIHERNPSVGTAWSLFRAFDVLEEPEWLGIWLSDWYLCHPLMPILDQAMSNASGHEDVEVFCTETLSCKGYLGKDPHWIETAPRKNTVRSTLIGGFNIFRRSLLRRVKPLIQHWASISNMFNRHMQLDNNIRFRAAWVCPPPPFLHIDYDLTGDSLTSHYYTAEGLDTKQILRLVGQYAKRRWARSRVAPDGKTVVGTGGDVRRKEITN